LRETLVAALVSCADSSLKLRSGRFLAGLSRDELQFIAEFLGCCILESARRSVCSRAQLAESVFAFQRARRGLCGACSEDQEHKMILLLEYLCCSGIEQVSMAHAGTA
jgi:hypothetical protein